MIWNEAIECADRETMQKIQLERLKETVDYVYENVGPYRKKMEEKGVVPGDIRTLADITKLPFIWQIIIRTDYSRRIWKTLSVFTRLPELRESLRLRDIPAAIWICGENVWQDV